MQLTEQEIEKIAHLSKLELSSENKKQMLNDMNKIIKFVDKINELDLEGVEPLIYVNEQSNVLRKDEISHELSQIDALKNAPNKDTDYIKVHKVLKS